MSRTISKSRRVNAPFLRVQEARSKPTAAQQSQIPPVQPIIINDQPSRVTTQVWDSRVKREVPESHQTGSGDPNVVGPSTDRESSFSREGQIEVLDTSDDTLDPTRLAYIIREGVVHRMPYFSGSGVVDKVSNKIKFWSSPTSAYKKFAFLDDDSKKAIQSLLEDVKPSTQASVKMEVLKRSPLRLSTSKESAILIVIEDPVASQNRNHSSTYKSPRRGTQHKGVLHNTTAALNWNDYMRELTTYKVISIQPLLEIQESKVLLDADSWANCTGSEQDLVKGDVLRRLAVLDKDGISISDKKARLQPEQREQVHRALQEAARSDPTPLYQWALRQLELVKSKASILRRKSRILALVIYLERSPRPHADLANLYRLEKQRSRPSGNVLFGAPAAMPGMYGPPLPAPLPLQPPLPPHRHPGEYASTMPFMSAPATENMTRMMQPRPAQLRDGGLFQYQAPPEEVGIKSEFGRMYSGIGSLPQRSSYYGAMPSDGLFGRAPRPHPHPPPLPPPPPPPPPGARYGTSNDITTTKTTYTRMARKHLSIEALRAKAIEFELDAVSHSIPAPPRSINLCDILVVEVYSYTY